MEELPVDSFASLRQNVHFASFLRTMVVLAPTAEKSITSTDPINNKRPSIELDGGVEPESITGSILKTLSVEQETIELPPPNTLLDEVQLPERFLKLFKRLINRVYSKRITN